MGKQWKQWQTLFSWAPTSLQMVTSAIKLKDACSLEEKLWPTPTNVCLVKAMVFPVVMYGCESWTIKKAEHQRIDAFKLWCWRRVLRVSWTARRSYQSILKEISPEYPLEGLKLQLQVHLKFQYFGHLLWRTDSFEKTLMLGKIEAGAEGDNRWHGWMASLTRWTWVCACSGSWWWTGNSGVLQSTGLQRVGHNWLTKLSLTEFITISLHILKKCSLWYLIVFSSFCILLYISFFLSTLGYSKARMNIHVTDFFSPIFLDPRTVLVDRSSNSSSEWLSRYGNQLTLILERVLNFGSSQCWPFFLFH